jgi:Xaa-Pro aminopeptidase
VNKAEYDSRRSSAAAVAAGHKLDALLVTGLPNVRYLTGFTGSNGAVLLLAGGGFILFTDPRYTIQAAQETGGRVVTTRKPLMDAAAAEAARRRIRKLGFEAQRIGFEAHERLRSKLPRAVELEPARGLVETLRARKSPAELELIRRSVEVNSRAYEAALRAIRPGKTSEADLAAEIEHRMRRLGAEKPAFETIVAGGEHAALPHAHPGKRKLGANELLLIDMGATLEGYASDMTRVVSVGRAPAEARRVYGAVLEAQLAAIDAVRAGATAGDVDRAARKVLRAKGLDRAFVHSTGHGLGLEIHETPRVGKGDKTRLEEGMAITIEPGAYLEGKLGVRIEDTVAVTRTGCEVLTPTPKDYREL